jgi:hypothetical protein
MDDVSDLIQRYTAAFNARDLDAFRSLLTEDVEFRRRNAATLRGYDGARAVILAAEDANLRLELNGEPEVEGDRLTVPVRVVTGNDEVRGTAVFEIKDGRVAAFEVVTDD